MATEIVFGLGGYDPTEPDDNIIEVIQHPDEPQVDGN